MPVICLHALQSPQKLLLQLALAVAQLRNSLALGVIPQS